MISSSTRFRTSHAIKVAWLCNFDLNLIADNIRWRRQGKPSHPCSWITNLARALAKRSDVELSIVTYSPYVAGTQKIPWNGISVTVVQAGVPFIPRGWPSWLPLNAALGFPMEVHKLRKAVLNLGSFDLVHAHGTEDAYALAGLGLNMPCVVSMQGIISEIYRVNRSLRYRFVRHWERKAVRNARFFMCRTCFDTQFVRSINPSATIFEVWEAINPIFWGPLWKVPEGFRILFLGGDLSHKGLLDLISAVQVCSPQIRSLEVVICGYVRPLLQRQLSTMVRAAEVQLTFAGRLQPDAIAQLHRQCRVFVLPSKMENSPNALAEAMVSGMPVVAFDVGGVSSMIEHEVTGLLVPPGDIQGLATAIRRVLTDDELAARLGAAAAKVARARHHPDDVADKTVQVYHKVVEASGR